MPFLLHVSNMIRFSLVRISLDMILKKILESDSICTGIAYFTMSSNCSQIEIASLEGSATTNSQRTARNVNRVLTYKTYMRPSTVFLVT